tara:strand:+ start:1664 stop:2044 length:381 start_codon:yes stop_codon:yes gene_type:complete
MGYGSAYTQTLANLPVVNGDFTVVQVPSSGAGATGVDFMAALDLALNNLGAALPKTFPSVKRAIVISNDHATVPCYIRSRGSNTDNRGIKIAAGESLFLAITGVPGGGNEIYYQATSGTLSVAVYF